MPSSTLPLWRTLALLLALAVIAGACGDDEEPDATSGTAEREGGDEADTLRLGYFPNVTHATALVGVESGSFQEALGGTTLETSTFNAGTEAVEALLSGALDASFIGPNPAINAYAQSEGEAIRILAGATSGGASLVTRPDITDVEGLRGTTLATPSLGNTQDVALRSWLLENGIETATDGGGDVEIVNQENAQTLDTFKAGEIDGAWLPEPWATRLIEEAGAEVLLDEATLWPEGEWVTTHLIVRTEYLEENPGVVRDLLEGLVAADETVNADRAAAADLANDGIEAITDKRLDDAILTAAFENLTFTIDPIASSLATMAEDAEAVGLLEPVELDGIYDLDLLNEVLDEAGDETVEAA